MKLCIHSNNKPQLDLILPTGLLLNRFSAQLIANSLRLYKIRVSQKEIASFLLVLNHCRKEIRDWTLVEVTTASGDCISIKL